MVRTCIVYQGLKVVVDPSQCYVMIFMFTVLWFAAQQTISGFP